MSKTLFMLPFLAASLIIAAPSEAQTAEPAAAQSAAPAAAPAEAQTAAPTETQTAAPVEAQTATPAEAQTTAPAEAQTAPVEAPTAAPAEAPTAAPADAQAAAPAVTKASIVTPAEVAANQSNRLNLELSTGGTVVIQLRPDAAPNHVQRIQTLASQDFYNGLTFHRVIPGFMAQGGDPTGTGGGGSKLPDLAAEFNTMPHMRGVVSMARTEDPNSANSQFFIILSPTLSLDKDYTAFGRVVSGMQFVDQIAPGEPPAQPTRIVRAWLDGTQPAAVTQAVAQSEPAPAPAEAAVPVPAEAAIQAPEVAPATVEAAPTPAEAPPAETAAEVATPPAEPTPTETPSETPQESPTTGG